MPPCWAPTARSDPEPSQTAEDRRRSAAEQSRDPVCVEGFVRIQPLEQSIVDRNERAMHSTLASLRVVACQCPELATLLKRSCWRRRLPPSAPGDHLQVGLALQKAAEPLPNDLLVVGQQYAGHGALRDAGRPGGGTCHRAAQGSQRCAGLGVATQDGRGFHMREAFRIFASRAAEWVGTPGAFVLGLGLIVLWALTGPLFGYSDTWQLVVNTTTTIVTFLMVFLIQNTQNRDTRAIHLKLDELIRGVKGARTAMVALENSTDEELAELQAEFDRLHRRLTARGRQAPAGEGAESVTQYPDLSGEVRHG